MHGNVYAGVCVCMCVCVCVWILQVSIIVVCVFVAIADFVTFDILLYICTIRYFPGYYYGYNVQFIRFVFGVFL